MATFSVHHIAVERSETPAGQSPEAATEGSFEDFFHQHDAEIVGYLWRMTCDEQVAYDLTQEVFLRAWSHFAEIRTYDRPRSWLFRVATNLALNHLRRDSLWRKVSTPLSLFTASPQPHAASISSASVSDAIPATTGDPATAIAEREAIREALLALKPQYRAALVLHSVYGMTCAEIGEMLGLSLSGAKTTLARGREKFRAHYQRDEQDSSGGQSKEGEA